MLPEVPDPDDAHSQRFMRAFLQCSRARPCLPRCCASMNSSRFFTSGAEVPVRFEDLQACAADIFAR